jgi:hypothetical protein
VGNAINDNFSLTGDLVYLANTTAMSGLVPAVSTWGLAVLTLAMLAAGAATLKCGPSSRPNGAGRS